MKKMKLIAAFLALIISSGCDKAPIDHSAEYMQIKSANKVVFAQMAITKTARKESSRWYTLGKRVAVYSYDSYLQAYIDLSELRPEDLTFDDDAHTVSVVLPSVRIETAGRDMELKREYENIGLMRADLDSKERAEMKEKANDSFRREVIENSEFRSKLLGAAERKARLFIEELFAAQGYDATVVFKAPVVLD